MGERTVRIRKVVGSNPFRSTIKSREIKRFRGFLQLSDDRKDILPAAMSVGIGFSILENTAILVQNLTVVTLGWAALRGLSASLMHGLCTMIIGAGLPYVKKQRKLFCTGIFGLFTVSATMHALFNLLIQSDYSWLGACFPMALYVLFYVVRRTGRVKLPFLSY